MRVLTAGGELGKAAVRAAAHHARPDDHIEVRLLLDYRWLEPAMPDVEFMSMSFVPEEEDPASNAFLQELDEKLEAYGSVCAEGAATFATRRVLGLPDEAVADAASGADLLVLPHPVGASAEMRKALVAAVAAPPVPLLVVASRTSATAATIQTDPGGKGLNGAHTLLDSVLGGRVNRIAVEEDVPAEPFKSLAPVVEETTSQRGPVEDSVDPSEMYVVLHAARGRGVLGLGSKAKRRLTPQRSLLLVPDDAK